MIRSGASITPPRSSVGVPTQSVPYGTAVDTWWSTHYSNPQSTSFVVSITSPSTLYDVDASYAGNLQNAINALPSSGGTLLLGNGPYSLADCVGKSNVHFLGNGSTVCRGIRVFGASITQTYFGASNNGWVNAIWANDATALAAANTRPSNFYFKNIQFNGNGATVTVSDETPANTALFFRGVKDILVDDCTFTNYDSSASSWHPGLISGNGLVENLWARRCSFSGPSKIGFFCDGLHNGGAVLCTFSATLAGSRVAHFVNNDFTWDYGGDGQISGMDNRAPCYCAYAYNQMPIGASSPSTMFTFHGGPMLVEKNITTVSSGVIGDYVNIATHCYNPNLGAYLTGGAYANHGTIVRNNVVGVATNGLHADVTGGSDPSGASTCTAPNYGVVGQYTLTGNSATTITNWTSHTGVIDTPNTASGNTP
jgi:hypothetical protein